VLQAPAYQITHPSFEEPEILMQISQASGFVDVLADGQLRTRLGEDDLIVYMKQLNLRTKAALGQASSNELPGVDIIASMISTATYRYQSRSIYDHHDVSRGNLWGFDLVSAYRHGMRQGFYTTARDACLYGINPANGEGLINASGSVAMNLPPDQYNNTTVTTYDNGSMAFFLNQQFLNLKTRTNQLGIGRKFTILGPQRTLGLFEYSIVQLTQMQRTGAGSLSTAGVVKEVLLMNGDTLVWAYDDSLIGAGTNGTDLVMIVMPEVAVPVGKGQVNTNYFAELRPNAALCTTMYCDMAAPREVISPMAQGKTDFMLEWRTSSGWAPRAIAITQISMQYQ
jgi:hypothetical protein